MKALVVQKGAREHFLVARALCQRDMLAGLVVDWHAPHTRLGRFALGQLGGRRAASALAAACPEVPRRLVQSFPLRSVFWKWQERRLRAAGRTFDGFDQTDAAFAQAAARLPLPEHDVFFGYSYASLEMLELEKQRGVFTVVDQIDPGPVEYRLVAAEMKRHPGLAGLPAPYPQNHFDRARREWDLADMIVVNSEWTREAIIHEGAPAEKIETIPLCYEDGNSKPEIGNRKPQTTEPARAGISRPKSGKLRILFLGQVSVRKGIHHLIEAARRLRNEPVEFLIAGPLDIRRETMEQAPENMRWIGAVPRSSVAALYQQADVFVLPTLSDGFAITQLEALAHGVPVIVTPNCGRVVEDAVTGFLIPASDATALARVIAQLIREPERLAAMKPRCIAAAKACSIDDYGQRFLNAIQRRRTARREIVAAPALAGYRS